MRKRILSIFLSVCLALSLLPTGALAADSAGAGAKTTLDISKGSITIGADSVSGKDSEGNNVTTANSAGYIITSSCTESDECVTINGAPAGGITLQDLTWTGANLQINADVTLDIAGTVTLSTVGVVFSVAAGKTLTLTGSGNLSAVSKASYAVQGTANSDSTYSAKLATRNYTGDLSFKGEVTVMNFSDIDLTTTGALTLDGGSSGTVASEVGTLTLSGGTVTLAGTISVTGAVSVTAATGGITTHSPVYGESVSLTAEDGNISAESTNANPAISTTDGATLNASKGSISVSSLSGTVGAISVGTGTAELTAGTGIAVKAGACCAVYGKLTASTAAGDISYAGDSFYGPAALTTSCTFTVASASTGGGGSSTTTPTTNTDSKTTTNTDGSTTKTDTTVKTDSTGATTTTEVKTTTNTDGTTTKVETATTKKTDTATGAVTETTTQKTTDAAGKTETVEQAKTVVTDKTTGAVTEKVTQKTTDAAGKTETVEQAKTTVTDKTTGAKTEIVAEAKTTADGTTTKVETVKVAGGTDGVTAEAKVETGKTGEAVATATIEAPATATTTTLPAAVVEAVTKADTANVTVKVGEVSVALDKTAVEAVKATGGEAPTLSATPVAAKDLPSDLQSATTAYDFKVSGKGVNFGGGSAIVSVPYTKTDPAKAVAVYHIDAAGNKTRVYDAKLTAGTLNIPTTGWSTYAVLEVAPLAFTDVKDTNWFYGSVQYAVDNSLFKGTSATTFGPAITMDRAMLVTVLYRMAGSPAVTAKSNFSDVASDAYYADAVAWASANKLVTGFEDGSFRPNIAVTREQMVAILYRYAALKSAGTGTTSELSAFTDAANVSSYALPAVKWAVGAKLLTGSDGKLNPADGASRAEVAAVLMRFGQKIAK